MNESDREELVTIIANYYIDKYKCIGCRFIINRRLTKTMGQCQYGECIELSAEHIATDSMASIIDTIVHELSHFLVGPDVKEHGREWQKRYEEMLMTY